MSKYNWKKFTEKSDVRYRKARIDGDLSSLKTHNILSSGDVELRFINDVLKLFANENLVSGMALDVCCGAGHMSECLNDFGMRVTGFDLNEDAILLAKSNIPEASFYVCDAVNLPAEISEKMYDFILVREAHPFSRIDEFEYQSGVIELYLSMLNPGGSLVIAHANHGGGLMFPSISFKRLRKWAKEKNYMACGPFYMFLYKHLHLKSPGKILLHLQSFLSFLLAKIFRQRWIQFFFIIK